MGNLNSDMLGVIYKISNNDACILINKEIYNIIVNNSMNCSQCHKLINIYGIEKWVTDDKDVYNNTKICHGYYDTLDKYRTIKQMIIQYPKFVSSIKRQCYTLCLFAINTDPKNIQYINNPSEDLCIMAIKKQSIINHHNYICNYKIFILKYIKNQTIKICETAIKYEPLSLLYVIDKTVSLCLQAVMKDGLALEYVPEHLQTEELCKLAIENKDHAFQYVCEKYQTHEMCLQMLTKSNEMINYIKNPREEYYIMVFKSSRNHLDSIFYTDQCNTGFGHQTLLNCDGDKNIAMGYQSGKNIKKNNNIMIGNEGVIDDEGVIKIGNQCHVKNYQHGIYDTYLEDDCKQVYITSDGQLGTK